MIVIDKVQVPLSEVIEEFGVPFEKIEKAPEFELNKARKNEKKFGQSKEISAPAGTRVPANFFVKWKGRTIEIRYAETINPKQVGDKIIEEYFPLKVMYQGEAMLVEDTLTDLAVFFWLHPLQETSPFRDQMKEKFHWSFKDMEAKGKIKVMDGQSKMYALNAINSLSGTKLRVIAKGLNITGVDNMKDMQIRGELFEKADREPTVLLNAINQKEVQFRGLIINAVDRGLFMIQEQYGARAYFWGAGPKSGTRIVDVPNGSPSELDVLLNHIMGNINNYYADIMDVSTAVQAQSTAKAFLENVNFDLDEAIPNNEPSLGEQLKQNAEKKQESAQIGGSSSEVATSFTGGNTEPDDLDDEDDYRKDENGNDYINNLDDDEFDLDDKVQNTTIPDTGNNQGSENSNTGPVQPPSEQDPNTAPVTNTPPASLQGRGAKANATPKKS